MCNVIRVACVLIFMQLGEAALRVQAAKGLADGHAGDVVGYIGVSTPFCLVTDDDVTNVACTVPTYKEAGSFGEKTEMIID